MKVCILTERMRIGFGVDLVVDEQAKRLVKLGFDVTVMVIHADVDQPPHDYRLVVINRLVFGPEYGSEEAMRAVLTKCGVIDSDVWIAHSAPFYEWLRWLDAPVIILEHGTPPGKFFPPHIGNPLDAFIDYRLNNLYRSLQPFDKIVSISRAIHNWLPEAIQPFSRIIYEGADHYPKAKPENVLRLREQLGVAGDGGIALWVGRMQLDADEQPYKGFREILEIAPKIIARAPGYKFVLAGRVSEYDAIELESRGFKVLANLSSEELATAMAAADLLLNVSQWEGFNLALLEAQHQGTPVVAYDFGPHREVVSHGKSGILARDVDGIIEAAVKIACDADLKRRLSSKARNFAENFTWDKNVGELVSTIQECLEKAPPREELRLTRKQKKQASADPFSAPQAAQKQEVAHAKRQTIFNSKYFAGFFEWLTGRKDNSRVDPRQWMEFDNEQFVSQAFHVLLNREAEPQAVDAYSARLNFGETRASVLAEIRFSPEGLQRRLDDPYLVSLIASEFVHNARDPQLGMGDIRRSVDGLTGEIRNIHAQLAAVRQEVADNKNHVINHVATSNDQIYALVSKQSYDLFGKSAINCIRHPEYTILIAADGRLNQGAAQMALPFAGKGSGDIIFGDERQLLAGAAPRLFINGPLPADAASSARFGKCILVRNQLLARLNTDRTSVLTPFLAETLLQHAGAISYLPIILSESASSSTAVGDGANGAPMQQTLEPEAELRSDELASLATIVAPLGGDAIAEGWLHRVADFTKGCGVVIVLVGEAEREALQETAEGCSGAKLLLQSIPNGCNVVDVLNDAIRQLPASIETFALVERSCALASDQTLKMLAGQLSDLSVGAVSPLIFDQGGKLLNGGLAVDREHLFSVIGQYLDVATETGPIYRNLQASRPVTAVSDGFILFRRRTFDLIGGFDASLNATAATIDFCLQARSYGLSIIVNGRAAATSADLAPKWGLRFSVRDAFTLIARHGSWIARHDEFWIEREMDGRAASIVCLTSPMQSLRRRKRALA